MKKHPTNREMDTLRCLARGMTNLEIATELHVSLATVKTHVEGLMTFFGVLNRLSVVIVALKQGYISLNDINVDNGILTYEVNRTEQPNSC